MMSELMRNFQDTGICIKIYDSHETKSNWKCDQGDLLYVRMALTGGSRLGALNDPSLTSCRKLRHLQGLIVRNIDVTATSEVSQRQTLNDDFLPASLITSAKALSLAEIESHDLEHSKSSDDLSLQATRSGRNLDTDDVKGTSQTLRSPQKSRRKKLERRRSAMKWSAATPQSRQEEMYMIAAERIPSAWYSLHVKGVREPIYISEELKSGLDPDFNLFDLSMHDSSVTRLSKVTVKLWTKLKIETRYNLMLEADIDLEELNYLGPSLADYFHPIPSNALLFQMIDGIYATFTVFPRQSQAKPSTRTTATRSSTESFDTILRLSTLDACIQDSLSTRHSLIHEIDCILQEQKQDRDIIAAQTQAKQRLLDAQIALNSSRHGIGQAQRRKEKLRASIQARRDAILLGDLHNQQISQAIVTERAARQDSHKDLHSVQEAYKGQLRRIGQDLEALFPISPTSPGSLTFSIRSLTIPLWEPSVEKEPGTIAAALGFAAHLTNILSYYLFVALPYPLDPYGSISTIYDPISATLPSEAARTFPLFKKGAAAYRFEYAVFLLNSDIELLMSKRGAKSCDLRYTLGNLKYILAVITGGVGEVPGRKKGLIKAMENSSSLPVRLAGTKTTRYNTVH